MNRLIVITLPDHREKPNNRIQHTVRAFRDGNLRIVEYDPPLDSRGHDRAVVEGAPPDATGMGEARSDG